MEYTTPPLSMKELRALLSETAQQHADKVFALYPFEFIPQALFDARWRRSPYLGRLLIANFKKGWFVYLFCGVNAAVFAIWQYPSLLDLPSKLFSSLQTKKQRPAASGISTKPRGLPSNVRTIHDLNLHQEGASPGQSESFLSLQNEAKHMQTLRRHLTTSLDNLAQGSWWTMFTSAVSHQNLEHIGKKMLTFISLATMGINMGLSNGQLFGVCLGSAVNGSIAQLWHIVRKVEGDRQSRRQGIIQTRYGLDASGIVSGLSVALAVAFPYAVMRVKVPLLTIPPTVPLWVIPFGSFAYDLWMLGDDTSKIGHAAHLGVALCGGLYSLLYGKGLTSHLTGDHVADEE